MPRSRDERQQRNLLIHFQRCRASGLLTIIGCPIYAPVFWGLVLGLSAGIREVIVFIGVSVIAVPLPPCCPHCASQVIRETTKAQYQEDIVRVTLVSVSAGLKGQHFLRF